MYVRANAAVSCAVCNLCNLRLKKDVIATREIRILFVCQMKNIALSLL